jgi:MFS transporter, OFA family, oxalate/formate antiporter
MVLIANLQYGWTLFVNPINKAHGWSIASIQLAFSIFIALETWLTPVHGWIVDSLGERRGAKLVVAIGGILVAVGWIVNAYAQSLEMLYLGAVVGGTGGGAVYATCVGQAVKWFPDRRGLAVGLTAAGYGAGAALTVVPIRAVINAYGYEAAFFWFGLVQGGIVFKSATELFNRKLPGLDRLPAFVAPTRRMRAELAESFQSSARTKVPGPNVAVGG